MLAGTLEAAFTDHGRALLVSGEAGIGKTSLVNTACAAVADDCHVVWASCLSLRSISVPFLPLTTAQRDWSEPAPQETWPTGFDHWLSQLCAARPTVLVVDDVQWADQGTLDVLTYVVAGLASRPLAVLMTRRTEELPDGHALHRWLADVRRLPHVRELPLGRLDRAATVEQLTDLLGAPPRESLVDDVYAAAQGNPYLASLLVRVVDRDAAHLPPTLPGELHEVVARSWHALSPDARALTGLVAVAGRPQQVDRLGRVATSLDLGGRLRPSLREAVDAGVLEVGPRGYWFRHPLLAEVLIQRLLPDERCERHAAFAAELETVLSVAGEVDATDAAELADHHHGAGHTEQAFRWSLRAADAAERAGQQAEALRLLHRAVELHPGTAREIVMDELLRRLQRAAERSGQQELELSAIDQRLAGLDRAQHPLLVAELLCRRMKLRVSTGREFAGIAEVRDAVALSAVFPRSAEHAFAVACLAYAELWHAEATGPASAERAVRLAEACGSPRALAYALTSRVMACVMAEDAGGFADAVRAQEAALAAQDFWAFVHSTLWGANSLDGPTSWPWVEHVARARERLTAAGAPHTYVALLSAEEASALLPLGDWQSCRERLRQALGSSPIPFGDALARLTAAELAVGQGRLDEARAHLARAEEVLADATHFLPFNADAVRAKLAVASGDHDGAVEAALSGLDVAGAPPTGVEQLLPLAARALADAAQATRDGGDQPHDTLRRLRGLRDRFPLIVVDPGPGLAGKARVRAMQTLYDAETLRAEADVAAGEAFNDAADACAAAALPWEEAYACWRWGEAMLRPPARRDSAATALRRGHEIAVTLSAVPLLSDVQATARDARIVLERPSIGGKHVAVLPGLTAREAEVLELIVAGRTYAEIARELVISEKTVSTHVSHLLHKSGTRGRIELAQLVRRLTDVRQRSAAPVWSAARDQATAGSGSSGRNSSA
jgi:DNA-binding CsgD family transcriptional regulator/tetratricopeptide (TPR) repeat protein